MDTSYNLGNSWEYIMSLLPEGWEELARSTKAVERRLREIPSFAVLMRLQLIHLGLGHSLRETVAEGSAGNLAHISDVALLKRLRKAGEFFRQLDLSLLKEQIGLPPAFLLGDLPVRLVDATHVKEPGKTGSLWRLHVALRLANLECDYFEVTPASGQGTGETFMRIPIQAGECLMGDRGYATRAGLSYVDEKGGFSLVRIAANFPMEDAQGEKVVLLEKMRTLRKSGDCGEWPVFLHHEGKVIPGRLCAIRKSLEAANQAIRGLNRREQKKQRKVNPETRELAQFVMVFTTVPAEKLKTKEILELYRYRWQIELLFKRFKSLANLGHLPKYEQESSKAWLYGKLLICLLTEKAITMAKKFSPWGAVIPEQSLSQSMA